MTVVVGATIWLLISLAVILYAVHAPRRVIQIPLGLLCLEAFLIVVAFSQRECAGGPCVGGDEPSGRWGTALTYVSPALAACLTVSLIAYGLRRHRVATS